VAAQLAASQEGLSSVSDDVSVGMVSHHISGDAIGGGRAGNSAVL
jgi:hypothetical protein